MCIPVGSNYDTKMVQATQLYSRIFSLIQLH